MSDSTSETIAVEMLEPQPLQPARCLMVSPASSFLQRGQEPFFRNHLCMHLPWKQCPQGSCQVPSLPCKAPRQTAQTGSSPQLADSLPSTNCSHFLRRAVRSSSSDSAARSARANVISVRPKRTRTGRLPCPLATLACSAFAVAL